MTDKQNIITNEDRKMLNSIFIRSFQYGAGRAGGQVRQHNLGFIYAVLPALNRYYKDDPEGRKNALIRHNQFFNVTNNFSTFIFTLVASMEREHSKGNDVDANSIVALKTALMGPLSGVGDSLFWGVLRVIAAGVGISLASEGSVLGPIMFLLIYNIPSIAVRYYLTFAGFKFGTGFVEKLTKSGTMDVLSKGASILGLITIGAMTASSVTFNTILEIGNAGGDPILLQQTLDQIFVGLVPLSVTLGCYKLLDKQININIIMLLVILLAVVAAILGVV